MEEEDGSFIPSHGESSDKGMGEKRDLSSKPSSGFRQDLALVLNEESSNDENEELLGEYYCNFDEQSKKRIRITVLESVQKKISKWERNFKKPRALEEKFYHSQNPRTDSKETIYSDCNSSFSVDTGSPTLALDLVSDGIGSIGCQDKYVVPVWKRQS